MRNEETAWETPLRCGNLRDPNGPQVTFAYESLIDEMAGADPVEFRLQLIEASEEDAMFRKARSRAVAASHSRTVKALSLPRSPKSR